MTVKQKIIHSPLATAAIRFCGLVMLFSISRLIFYLFNLESFPSPTTAVWLQGVRYDIIIILIVNTLYFIPNLLPFQFITNKTFRKIEDIGFILINSIVLVPNLIDTCYYAFAMRRMTTDIFDFVGETNNMGDLIPMFLKDYFYMIFIFIGFVFALILLVTLTNQIDYQNFKQKGKHYWIQIGLRIIVLFFILTGMRGGWQYRPLNIASAANAGGIENSGLVLNSPFTLLTTINKSGLDRKQYMSDEECRKHFSTWKTNFDVDDFVFPETKNIVIIILEGISSEYSTFLADTPKNIAGFTPFLDSLAQKSVVFRGFANGQQSIAALSSILGGIPSLMETPFSQSQYAANPINYAVPKLKAHGLHTMFFHGGKNGTMGFDRFCQIVGMEKYYGLTEYTGPKSDFDGTWGIEDLPYLQYVADVLSHETKPFFATIFTLSSHHPFIVPKEYDKQLPFGSIPMQHCVAYTDLALKEFFAKAAKTEWFNKTLFVITADHTNFKDAKEIDYQKNRYSVPMIFYHPKSTTAFRSETIMQQTDIMPTIFAYCGFHEPFHSFGSNAFNEMEPHFAINYLPGTYQLYMDHYLIESDGKSIRYIWDLRNINGREPIDEKDVLQSKEYLLLLQSVVQQFHNGLIDNKLR